MANTITSVLGFNFNIEIKDQDGNPLPNSARNTCRGIGTIKPQSKILDTRFFTNYNHDLLDQIRKLRRLQD